MCVAVPEALADDIVLTTVDNSIKEVNTTIWGIFGDRRGGVIEVYHAGNVNGHLPDLDL
jgi:hypothetical protein